MSRFRAFLVLAALTLPLAACGSDDYSSDEPYAGPGAEAGYSASWGGSEGYQQASAARPAPAARADGRTFTDPVEQSFRIAVPQGWDVEGGGRRNKVEYHRWYRLRSDDGRSEVFAGDPQGALQFALPNPLTQQQGLREGQRFGESVLRRFVPPAAFAAEYAARYAQRHGCSGFRVTRELSEVEVMERMTPTVRQRMQREQQKATSNLQQMASAPPQLQFLLGGVEFACADQEGTVYTSGFRYRIGEFGGWGYGPSGFVGPAGSREELQRLGDRVADSFEQNPRWEQQQDQRVAQLVQRQQQENLRTQQNVAQINARTAQINAQGAADRSRIIADTYSDISDMQMQGWRDRQNSSDEMHRRSVNAINGTADVYNPQSGTTAWGVDNTGGADAWWGNGTGGVVGTEGYDNPDAMQYDQAYDLDQMYDQGATGDDW